MPRRPTTAPAGAAKPRPPYQVFVSHATPDKWVATVICEKIDAIPGAKSFRDDRDIKGGDDIPESLRRELKRSAELVVLITPVSVGRPWVMLEVGAAWELDKRIVSVCYHVDADTIPAILSKKKAYALNEFDRYLEELRGRIEEGVS